MREIKFRVWGAASKRMIPWGDLLKLHLHTVFKMTSPPCDVMQYTGLKDKNGKEIYDGDIVDYGGVHFVYEWNCNGLWMCKRASDNFKVTIDYWDCEVIGNIYENPNLLDNKGE